MATLGNPRGIRGVTNLMREDIRFVNREPGAALRTLLKDCLAEEGIPVEAVRGFDDLVTSHSQGAQRVCFETADAALGLRVVASAYGLAFIGLSAVRCGLVIPGGLMDHPAVKGLSDVIRSKAFRDELGNLPGCETSDTGKVIARR